MARADETASTAARHGGGAAASRPPGGRRRFRWGLGLLAAAAIAGLAALAINLAPSYIARSLVRTYFQGLAIDTSGVETIAIRPLRGEIRFGPVRFRGSDGEPGQIGQIAVRIDVRRLLTRQALVSAAAIEGIRIDIRQDADGAISVNGVPLTRILAERAAKAEAEAGGAPPSATDATDATEAEDAAAWGAGLDRLELRDSQVVFTDARGGQATIRVDGLDLKGFATWTPDDPGRFRLDGSLNEIGIAIAGTATPFARSVEIDATVEVTGIELGKVEQFAGPLGFEPNAGRVDVSVAGKGSVDVAVGRIEAVMHGKAALTGIDMANPAFGTLRLAAGTLNLDGIRLVADAAGRIDIAGDAGLDLGRAALRLDDGTEIGAAAAKVGLPGLTAAIVPDAAPVITATPQLDVEALTLGGPDIGGRIATAAVRLTRLDVDAGGDGTPITLTGSIDAAGLDLTVPDAQPIRITLDRLKADLDGARFAFPPGATRIDGGFGIDAGNVAVAISAAAARPGEPAPAIRIAAGTLAGRLPTLAVDAGSAGTRLKITSPALAMAAFRLEMPLAPGSGLTLGAPRVELKAVDVDVADAGKLEVGGRAGLTSPALTLAISAADPAAAIDAGFTRAEIDLARFRYAEDGATSGIGLKGRIGGDRLNVRIGGRTAAARTVDLAGIDLDLDDLDWQEGGAHPRQRLLASLSLTSAEAMIPGERMPVSASIDGIDLRRLEVDPSAPGRYGFERLALGKLDVSLTRRAAAGAAPAAPADAAAGTETERRERTWPPAGLPAIRIGAFGLREGGRISILDQSLSPPATATLSLDTLSLQNVDSTRPAERAELRLRARLGDGALTADGWALPFASRPDFDLRARIEALAMPDLNPYAAPAIGLDIIDGQLLADAEGKAAKGRLTGEVRATLAALRFADRPEAGGDRVSRQVGLPLSTLIGLLEDSDGTIDVTLPFEGDLMSPAFDYSDMIWSALFRVLRALVTSPFALVSASAALIGGGEGGAPGVAAAAEPSAAPPGLAPLVFAPGTAVVAGDTQRAVVGLRQVLRDRPRLTLALCGIATAADAERLIGAAPPADRAAALAKAKPQLEALARARTRAVSDGLTEGGGVDRQRLRLCGEARVDPADAGPPRVALGF